MPNLRSVAKAWYRRLMMRLSPVRGGAMQQATAAAATAVLNYDLMTGQTFRLAPFRRYIKRAGLAGSAAVGDTQVRLMAGQVELVLLNNTALGMPSALADMNEIGGWVPAGVELRGIVVDAPATNPINLFIDIEDYPSMRY